MRPHFDIRGTTGADKQIGQVGCCVCANARTWSTVQGSRVRDRRELSPMRGNLRRVRIKQ